jgi:hypothetical protein
MNTTMEHCEFCVKKLHEEVSQSIRKQIHEAYPILTISNFCLASCPGCNAVPHFGMS